MTAVIMPGGDGPSCWRHRGSQQQYSDDPYYMLCGLLVFFFIAQLLPASWWAPAATTTGRANKSQFALLVALKESPPTGLRGRGSSGPWI